MNNFEKTNIDTDNKNLEERVLSELPDIKRERRESSIDKIQKKIENEEIVNKMLGDVREQLKNQETEDGGELPEIVFESLPSEDEEVSGKIENQENLVNIKEQKHGGKIGRWARTLALSALTALGIGASTEASAADHNRSDSIKNYESRTHEKLNQRNNKDMRDAVAEKSEKESKTFRIGHSIVLFKYNSSGNIIEAKTKVSGIELAGEGKGMLRDDYRSIIRDKYKLTADMNIQNLEQRVDHIAFLEKAANVLQKEGKHMEAGFLNKHVVSMKKATVHAYGNVLK